MTSLFSFRCILLFFNKFEIKHRKLISQLIYYFLFVIHDEPVWLLIKKVMEKKKLYKNIITVNLEAGTVLSFCRMSSLESNSPQPKREA